MGKCGLLNKGFERTDMRALQRDHMAAYLTHHLTIAALQLAKTIFTYITRAHGFLRAAEARRIDDFL